jgi:hypothetical protein
MAHSHGAFDGLRRFAVLQQVRPPIESARTEREPAFTARAERDTMFGARAERDTMVGARAEREAMLGALDDIAEEARAVADFADRVDQNTMAMADQLSNIEHRFTALRLGATMFAVGQVVLLALILWRVW